jgi:hypothetical protein
VVTSLICAVTGYLLPLRSCVIKEVNKVQTWRLALLFISCNVECGVWLVKCTLTDILSYLLSYRLAY